MTTNITSRRSALKLLLVGSVAVMGTACEALKSLPRGQVGGSTDGSELAMDVRRALREHPYTSRLSVDISSSGDVVILKGWVENETDRQNLELVANQVAGVRHAQMDVYIRD